MTNPVVSACPELKLRMPTEETFMLLRKAYAEVEGISWNANDWREEAMEIPYEIKMDPIRGRGVFATEKVSKDTQIWKNADVAQFRERDTFVAFLELIPRELQCDILLWAYPVHGMAEVDLDPGSLINHSTDPEEINMNIEGYASRDIRKGEPILMNYDDFIEYNAVPWFDEIRTVAWAQQPKEGDGHVKVYKSTDSYNQLGAPGSAAEPIKAKNPEGFDALAILRQLPYAPVVIVGCVVMILILIFVLRKRFFGRVGACKKKEA